MILKTLVENTSSSSAYKSKHGMCLYIDTGNHKILFDLGKNKLFLENAIKMGVKISEIDIVVISHGHMDHGGALKLFLENNKSAKVYVRENAFDKHYIKFGGIKINVGIDSAFKYHPQVILTDKKMIIDDGIILFSDIESRESYSKSNDTLFSQRGKEIYSDDFSHEQSLIILKDGKSVLITGCSHNGIINIKNKAGQIINDRVDYIIGGFHLYNPVSKRRESDELIEKIARELDDEYTIYYTCHCTGEKVFYKMKKILLERLMYLATGTEIES